VHNKIVLLFVAAGYSITLAVLSLVSNDTLPNLGTDYDDKVYHLLAYALLTFLWFKVFTNFNNSKPILLAFIISIVFGIIIEVLQGAFTVVRDPSIMDILANSIGVAIVSLILLMRKITIVKKK
jgi:VanZ family protein